MIFFVSLRFSFSYFVERKPVIFFSSLYISFPSSCEMVFALFSKKKLFLWITVTTTTTTMTKTTTAIVREFKPPQRETKTTTAQKTSRRRSEGKKKSFPKDPKRRNKLSRKPLDWMIFTIYLLVGLNARTTNTNHKPSWSWTWMITATVQNETESVVRDGAGARPVWAWWSLEFSIFGLRFLLLLLLCLWPFLCTVREKWCCRCCCRQCSATDIQWVINVSMHWYNTYLSVPIWFITMSKI